MPRKNWSWSYSKTTRHTRKHDTMSESQQTRETPRFQIVELLDTDSNNSVKEIISKFENFSKELEAIKRVIIDVKKNF